MSMQRCVTVASGRVVTLGQYVAAVQLAKREPDAMFKSGLSSEWPTSGAEVVRQFREGMVDRLNQAVPRDRRGLDGPVLREVEKPVRMHRNQAQWRRRLKGRRHVLDGFCGREHVTICERCEDRFGVPPVEAYGESYVGLAGKGEYFILGPAACDHPRHWSCS